MTLDTILTHAAVNHGDRAVIGHGNDRQRRISNYRELLTQAQSVSAALWRFGIRPGDRVGSLMWNDPDHLAIWFGVMSMGAVMHTLNPRLGAERIAWIAAHGGDRLIFCSEDLQDLLRIDAGKIGSVERIVVSSAVDAEPMPRGSLLQSLDSFLDAPGPIPIWGDFDENSAAGLCYTSGTTGDPKGVLYSHRSNMLHALAVNQPGGFGIGPADTVLAIVPMFHANAWALPFIAPLVGAELVLPGRDLGGGAITRLINERGVTFAAGVPTIWQELLRHLGESGAAVPTLKRAVIGGSAPSRGLVEQLDSMGIEVIHAWGMTELSPIGSISSSHAGQVDSRASDRVDRILRQGRPPFPVQAGIFDQNGGRLAHDDVSAGELKVRGPNVTRAYFGAVESAVDDEGWFGTGDIASIDCAGSIRLVDRAKDVIKSGGEWISSIELENLAMTHPDVHRAAVIGVPDEKWGERPLLIIEASEPAPPLEILIEHLGPSVPAWWLPSRVEYCVIPLGATGKIDKLALRRLFLDDKPRSAAVASPPPMS